MPFLPPNQQRQSTEGKCGYFVIDVKVNRQPVQMTEQLLGGAQTLCSGILYALEFCRVRNPKYYSVIVTCLSSAQLVTTKWCAHG